MDLELNAKFTGIGIVPSPIPSIEASDEVVVQEVKTHGPFVDLSSLQGIITPRFKFNFDAQATATTPKVLCYSVIVSIHFYQSIYIYIYPYMYIFCAN